MSGNYLLISLEHIAFEYIEYYCRLRECIKVREAHIDFLLGHSVIKTVLEFIHKFYPILVDTQSRCKKFNTYY